MKHAPAPAERKKVPDILLIDDEPVLLEIGQHFLERNDFSTDIACSADEALVKIAKYPYDAVVSDYQMPGKDGIALLKEVRAEYPGLPFILFTGRSREEIVIQALNEGADFYVQKGGDPRAQFADLTHKIRRAIERRNAAAAIEERNEVLGAILTASPFGIALIKNRTVQWLNESLAVMLGYGPEELIGMPVQNLYESEADYLSAGEKISSLLKTNGQGKIEVRLMRKDRSPVYCEAQMAALNTKNPLYSRMVTFTEVPGR